MITLNNPSQINILPLSPNLTTYLINELIEQPFENLNDANEFWRETSTQLILLDPFDSFQSLKALLPAHHLHQLTHFPEYIQKAPDGYFLSLVITDQAGGGYYLLFPDNTAVADLQQLKRIAQ